MTKHRATLEQIRRENGGLAWSKVDALLRHLASAIEEGRGSTTAYMINGVPITVHTVHGRKECGRSLVKRLKKELERAGIL